MLSKETVSSLGEVSAWLRERGLDNWAASVDAAILLNANLPNALKEARANGYQSALSHDCDTEEWGA